jgi:hypothetical protein
MEVAMAVYPSEFLYKIDPVTGAVSPSGFPNGAATSTESDTTGASNNVLVVGEPFTAVFSDPDTQNALGGVYTYYGAEENGIVGQHSNGDYYLFSNDAPIDLGDVTDIEQIDTVICFLAGTMIGCPAGERAIETLTIGEPVITADGRIVLVKWVGRQTVIAPFGMPEGRRPVVIAAGALAENMPTRDLRLTSDHALLIDGVLVQAGALVNGTSIRRIELSQRFIVYHIETENHDIVLAEGTPAETFIDNVSRRRFDNFAEYKALYGETSTTLEELPQPRAMSARQVPPSIRARIAWRAAVLAECSVDAA